MADATTFCCSSGVRNALTPPLYRPSRPERTLLHRIVRQHPETFLTVARQGNRGSTRYRVMPIPHLASTSSVVCPIMASPGRGTVQGVIEISRIVIAHLPSCQIRPHGFRCNGTTVHLGATLIRACLFYDVENRFPGRLCSRYMVYDLDLEGRLTLPKVFRLDHHMNDIVCSMASYTKTR